MKELLLIAEALMPAGLLLLALRRDRPWMPLLGCLALGALAAAPGYGLERMLLSQPWVLHNLAILIVLAFTVAIVEETCKLALCKLRLGPSTEYDGILTVTAVSLGFAALENVLYVLRGGSETAFWRALLAVPGHAVCGVLMGQGLGRDRLFEERGWRSEGWLAVGWGRAVLFHGVYDTIALQSGPWTTWALGLLVGAGAVWSLRAASRAYRRELPVWARRGLPRRHPVVASLLGLVPGLGQLYNGQPLKSALYFVLSAGCLGLACALNYAYRQPLEFGSWLLDQSFGLPWSRIAPNIPVLAGALGVLGLGMVYLSCWDAYRTARGNRSEWGTGLSASCLAHLTLALCLILVPAARAKPAGGPAEPEHMTWVEAPKTLHGVHHGSQGQGQGGGEKRPEVRREEPGASAASSAAAPKPRREVRRGQPGKTAGVAKSYNDYLTSHIFALSEPWWRMTNRRQWVVVQYRIAASGQVLSAERLRSGGPPEAVEDLLRTLREAPDFEPLPAGVKVLRVTELWWSSRGATGLTPGTLEERLSHLNDGRLLEVER